MPALQYRELLSKRQLFKQNVFDVSENSGKVSPSKIEKKSNMGNSDNRRSG